MVMLSCWVAVCVDESATFTVKVDFCEEVGVPEMTPVVGFKNRPAGRLPAVIVHERGYVPPLACKVAL